MRLGRSCRLGQSSALGFGKVRHVYNLRSVILDNPASDYVVLVLPLPWLWVKGDHLWLPLTLRFRCTSAYIAATDSENHQRVARTFASLDTVAIVPQSPFLHFWGSVPLDTQARIPRWICDMNHKPPVGRPNRRAMTDGRTHVTTCRRSPKKDKRRLEGPTTFEKSDMGTLLP